MVFGLVFGWRKKRPKMRPKTRPKTRPKLRPKKKIGRPKTRPIFFWTRISCEFCRPKFRPKFFGFDMLLQNVSCNFFMTELPPNSFVKRYCPKTWDDTSKNLFGRGKLTSPFIRCCIQEWCVGKLVNNVDDGNDKTTMTTTAMMMMRVMMMMAWVRISLHWYRYGILEIRKRAHSLEHIPRGSNFLRFCIYVLPKRPEIFGQGPLREVPVCDGCVP